MRPERICEVRARGPGDRRRLPVQVVEREAEQVPEEEPGEQIAADRGHGHDHRNRQDTDEQIGEREPSTDAPQNATQKTVEKDDRADEQ